MHIIKIINKPVYKLEFHSHGLPISSRIYYYKSQSKQFSKMKCTEQCQCKCRAQA